jgi:hypothetical protein
MGLAFILAYARRDSAISAISSLLKNTYSLQL